MELHRLIGHLPKNTAEVRRYRAVVGEMKDTHLAIETVLNPINAASAMKLIEDTPALKTGNKPLVDGHLLASEADLPSGRRLGRLKQWLYRLQVEQDLSNTEEVLSLLNALDWQQTNPEDWPDMLWP
jgi:hypothetical protein